MCSKFGGDLKVKYMDSKKIRYTRVPACKNREFDDVDEDIYLDGKASNGQEKPTA